jgi:uncharacterized protein (TIGR03435 family)
MMKAALLLVPFVLAAQTPPAFETASIKPSAEGGCADGSGLRTMPGGGFRADCASVKVILTWAYQLQNYQISGGPSWMTGTQWTIVAKSAAADGAGVAALPYEQMTDQQRRQTSELVRRRVQTLLADRFQLVLRRETRDEPIYALTVGKNGPKLKESEDQSSAGFLKRGRGQLTSRGSLLATVAQFLAIDLGRPVVDRTGLTGHYDFDIKWTPDRGGSADAEQGPTLFTAIQELGLKLEPAKGPVEMLIIERAEKPTDN